MRPLSRKCPFLVDADQTRKPGDIGGKYRGQPTLHRHPSRTKGYRRRITKATLAFRRLCQLLARKSLCEVPPAATAIPPIAEARA
jgi:hypothetical protein